MRSNKWMVWALATIGVLAAAGWQSSIAAPQTTSPPAAAPAENSPAPQNAAPPPTQQPAPPANTSENIAPNTPTIKTESRVVAVDAVVTDKKGNYVRDLTQTDFKVFEDKQDQPIVNFSNASAAGGSDGSGATRYLVLFFDDSTMSMSDQMWARQAAARFIDSTASSRRQMAVVEFGGVLYVAQNFTANTDRLKQVVKNLTPGSVHSNSTDPVLPPQLASANVSGVSMGADSNFAVRTMLLAIRSLSKNLRWVPGRKTLILFSEGFPLTPEVQSELTATIDAANKANVAIYPMDVRGLQAPGDVSVPSPISQLRSPDQPRLNSSETIRDSQSANRSTNDSARGARVVPAAFSPGPAVSPAQHSGGGGGAGGGAGGGGGHGGTGGGAGTGGGSGSGGGKGGSGGSGGSAGNGGSSGGGKGTSGGGGGNVGNLPGSLAYGNGTGMREIVPMIPQSMADNQQVLFALASGTGGLTIFNTNDLAAGLEKIGRDLDEYYILGYTPTHTADGNCHTINVKVLRPGLSVRARSGYCDIKGPDILLNQPEGKALEARAAAAQSGNIPASLEAPYFYTAPNVAHVNVAMEIPSSSVNFQKDKKDFHSDVDVLGVAYRPDGSVGARFSDAVHLNLAKDDMKGFSKTPFVYMNGFDAAPGKYNLKMVLSAGGESFATTQMPLEIEPYDGKQFGLSGVAMSNDARSIAALSTVLDSELLDERQPLVVKGMQIMPSPNNRFKKADQVSFYTEIYEPLVGSAAPFRVGIKYTIVDPKTNKPVFDSGLMLANSFIDTGSPVMPIGLFIHCSALPAGDYRLVVQAMDDQKHQSPERTADFHLE
jgi:VWFA-related protein